jgi:hypothetical protein
MRIESRAKRFRWFLSWFASQNPGISFAFAGFRRQLVVPDGLGVNIHRKYGGKKVDGKPQRFYH